MMHAVDITLRVLAIPIVAGALFSRKRIREFLLALIVLVTASALLHQDPEMAKDALMIWGFAVIVIICESLPKSRTPKKI